MAKVEFKYGCYENCNIFIHICINSFRQFYIKTDLTRFAWSMGVMIFIEVTREKSSAAEHLDENPKVYPLFVSCVLPFHMIFVIVDSRVKFLRTRFIACLLVKELF